MRDEKGRIATDSERLIMDVVFRNPGISRSALTHHTNWKQQSVYRMVDALVSRDLLEVGAPKKGSGPGQPSPRLSVNEKAGFAFGISVNTDVICLSLANLGCELVDWVIVETDPSKRDDAIEDLIKTADELREKHSIPKSGIVGFGVAISGYRLNQSDVYRCPAPLNEWSEVPLAALLTEKLAYPVWIENNANTGAVAEGFNGAGRFHPNFAYLSFNYGFGCGIIIEGQPLRGAHGNAGEISSIFERHEIKSRPALGELLKRINSNGGSITSIRELNAKFDTSLPGVSEWISEVRPHLNLTIRALSAIADPSAIVFGGEAPKALQDLLISACDPFGSQPPEENYPARPKLLNSVVEGDPATFGAALLPIKQSVLL